MELQPGERVIFTGHPSWRSILDFYFKGLALVILAAAIAALVTVISNKVDWAISGGAAGAALVLVVLVGLVKRVSTTYTITDRRLHIRKGVFTRVTRDSRLERVQNVNTRQSLAERLLRVGTVDFDTAGTDDSEFRFEWINDPESVVRAVDKATHEASQTPPPDAPPAAEPTAS